MAINFYERERNLDKNDIEITKSKNGFRLSIDRNIATKMFGEHDYIQVGFDEDEPSKLFFIGSDKKRGYKLNRDASANRACVNLSNKQFDWVGGFLGSFSVTKDPDSDVSFIDKKRGIKYYDKSMSYA